MKFFNSLVVCTFVFINLPAAAQVQIDQTLTPDQLVQDVLLGEGIEVFNITFNGQPGNILNNQICKYTGPSNFIAFDEGIGMVSGPVGQFTGQGGTITQNITQDPDLLAIANVGGTNYSVNNCAILEFDFIPTGDSINIRFVYMSFEYPSFTCSSFNDPFAFFLSGPGLSGPYSNNAVNIALIPNSNTPIGVNTINGGVPTGGGTAQNCFNANPNWISDSQYYLWNNPPMAGDIQFPGMTTTITGKAQVICGEVYHIKLAIADASDGALDSGVIIEAGSLVSSGYSVNFSSSLTDVNGIPFVYEACEPVVVNLTKGGCGSKDIDTLFLTVTGTATPGIDYEPIPDFVVFEAGSNSLSFELDIFADLDIEGIETIIITIQYINDFNELVTLQATLHIYDYVPVSLNLSDFTVPCPGDPVTISSGASGGVAPLQYEWNTGANTSSITVNVPETTTYTVTVTDFCGFSQTGSAVATLINWPPITVEQLNVLANCPGDVVQVQPNISGGSPPYTYLWNNNQTTPSINVTVNGTGTVTLNVTDQCGNTGSGTSTLGLIDWPTFVVNNNTFSIYCPGDDVTISVPVTGGAIPYTYLWAGGQNTASIVVNPNSTNTFSVAVSDQCQTLQATVTVNVPTYTGVLVSLPDSTCGAGSGLMTVNGGTGIYPIVYSEPEGFIFSGTQGWTAPTATAGFGAVYSIYATDECGNTGLANIVVFGCNTIIPNIFTPNGDNINDVFFIEGLINFPGSRLTIYNRWGQLVFEDGDYALRNSWDGSSVSDGVYFWILNRGDGKDFSGDVQIVRK
jgi:gliding motility-associated-like protein